MNKTIKIFALPAFLLLCCNLSAQKKTDYSDNPHRISIGYGMGISNVLQGEKGYCGSIEVTLPLKNNCLLFGFNNVIGLPPYNPNPQLYFFGSEVHEIRSYYGCYGRPWRIKSLQMGVYGGLAAMSGYDENNNHFSTIGLHAGYSCVKKLVDGLGLGADVFANYSLNYSDIGIRVFICLTD